MTTVRYFTNLMRGAPKLTNKTGCMTELLDACLVNGFDINVASTLTYAEGVATFTVPAGHAYQIYQVLRIEGATDAAYNGDVRVISTTTTTFTYAMSTPTESTAAGVRITAKVAPLGFKLEFSSGDKRAYRSENVLSKKIYLRVDDGLAPGYNPAFAKKAKVGMAQSMSDVNTASGAQAPFDPLSPRKNWEPSGEGAAIYDGWYKWYYAKWPYPHNYWNDTGTIQEYNRPWVLVGDDRGFYLFNEYGNSNGWGGRLGYCFTDFESYRQNDPFNTLLAATDQFYPANHSWDCRPDRHNWFNRSLDYTGKILLRDHTLIGGNQSAGFAPLNTNNGQTISGRATGIPFPNPVDYSLILHPVHLMQGNSKGLRGKMPGLMWVHNDQPLEDLEVVENVVGYAGRKFLMVKMSYQDEINTSTMAMDITGPWW